MSPGGHRERVIAGFVAGFAALTLLYSLLIVETPLLGGFIAILLVLLYLAWRFVRAHERLAAAMERRSDVATE